MLRIRFGYRSDVKVKINWGFFKHCYWYLVVYIEANRKNISAMYLRNNKAHYSCMIILDIYKNRKFEVMAIWYL